MNSKNFHIVHRLDKDTTGLMLIAKNRFYAKKFSEMFKLREIKKIFSDCKWKNEKNKGELHTKDSLNGRDIVSKLYFEVLSKKIIFLI